MPFHYKRKTDRGLNKEGIRKAFDEFQKGLSVRKAAEIGGVARSTLMDYIKLSKTNNNNGNFIDRAYGNRLVFSKEIEFGLCEYLKTLSNMFYGLTPAQVKCLAFQYAKHKKMKYPEVWEEKQSAGKDWFRGFMERNPTLSIRTPEATSYARISAFNQHTVETFHSKLEEVKSKYKFDPSRIFNLDETGISTTPKVPKIVGQKGKHQLGMVTSQERGELVTAIGIVSASGNQLPLGFVFPRVRFDERKMMNGTVAGSLGLTHKSGWMTSENFLLVMENLVKQTSATKDLPVLLIMDNHESHLYLGAIEFARDNGVIILTLPPHTSNRLQPLDVSIYGPFKSYFQKQVQTWMINNPGKIMSIYDLPALATEAWHRSATPTNILNGFKKTGISPFNRDVFTEQDFLGSYVSDRPEPSHLLESDAAILLSTSVTNNVLPPGLPLTSSTPLKDKEDASTSTFNIDLGINSTVFEEITSIKPLPKAPARKQSYRGRRRGRCMIATDTPEKDEIEKRAAKKKVSKNPACKRKIIEVVPETSSDEEIDPKELADDSSEYSTEIEEDMPFLNQRLPMKDDFVLVEMVPVNKPENSVHYVAKILVGRSENGEFKVNFLRMSKGKFGNTFSFPDIVDESLIEESAIKGVLPQPTEQRTKRTAGLFNFQVSFDGFNIR